MNWRCAIMEIDLSQECGGLSTKAPVVTTTWHAILGGRMPLASASEWVQVDASVTKHFHEILFGSRGDPGLLAILARRRALQEEQKAKWLRVFQHGFWLGMPVMRWWLFGQPFGVVPEGALSCASDGQIMPGGVDVAAGATYMLPKQRPLNTLEDSILRTIEVRAAFEQDCPHSAMFLEDSTRYTESGDDEDTAVPAECQDLPQEGFDSPWSLADDCCDFDKNSGFVAAAQDLCAPHSLGDGEKELVPFSCCDCQEDPRRAKNSAKNNGQHVPPSTPVERRPADGLKFPRSRASKANPEPPPSRLPRATPPPRSVPAMVSPAGLSAAS